MSKMAPLVDALRTVLFASTPELHMQGLLEKLKVILEEGR
jgi:hypothetical protein